MTVHILILILIHINSKRDRQVRVLLQQWSSVCSVRTSQGRGCKAAQSMACEWQSHQTCHSVSLSSRESVNW